MAGQNFLNYEYPAPKGDKKDLLISVLFGLFIGLFLWFFEPFDLNLAIYENQEVVMALFGLITTLVMLLFLFVLPRVFPILFDDAFWKIKHQALHFLVILFVIATANGQFINYMNDLPFTWSNYGWIIVRTYALGIIPVSILILVDHNRKLNFYLREANQINSKQPDSLSEDSIHLVLENGRHDLMIPFDDLQFIRADGNYVRLHRKDSDAIPGEIYRGSLTDIEDQLDPKHLVRCHRSYIVNLSQVQNITGNAQGLKLELKGTAETVPVSRKYLHSIRTYFNQG